MPISAKPPSIIDQSPELRPKSRPAVIRANILYNMNSLRRSAASTSITALVCEIRIQQRNLQIPALLSHVITHGFKHPVFLCPIDQSPSVQNCSPESGFGGSPRASEGGARAHACWRQNDRSCEGADHGCLGGRLTSWPLTKVAYRSHINVGENSEILRCGSIFNHGFRC
jgi:hypothetical protein